MPLYEFITSVTFTKFILVEADNQDDAYNIACSSSDDDIINDGDASFECTYNGTIE